jgi:CubicO group peptidase (beta-lactamase class C family)
MDAQDSAIQAPPAVRAAVADMMRAGRIPGLSLAVVNRDRVLWTAGFGYAQLQDRTPATADTSYLWFSMSKIVTATAVLRLADAGAVDLDAPAGEYVPFLAQQKIRPTVRDLLQHTAGLPDPLPIRWAHAAGEQHRDPAVLLSRSAPRRRPDGRARYSNLGYLALGELVAAVTGESFTDHVERHVLAPAGMTQTGFAHRGPAATGYLRAPRVADPLIRLLLPPGVVRDREGRFLALGEFYVDGPAYGGVAGPVTDAGRFLRLHLNDGHLDGHTILEPGTARRMRRIDRPGNPFDHGLGWFRRPGPGDDDRVEHFGAGVGYWNVMRLYPRRGLGVVVMANTTRPYAFEPLLAAIVAEPWT